jgi:hypothetical protein
LSAAVAPSYSDSAGPRTQGTFLDARARQGGQNSGCRPPPGVAMVTVRLSSRRTTFRVAAPRLCRDAFDCPEWRIAGGG